MAILRFPISPSEHCIFAIFKPINFKFWVLICNYITTNDTSGFFDKLSISSVIELELGPSRIKGFFYYISLHFISLHLDIEFRVNLMIYFGSSNHKKK
jgi:ABC-type microcin C transport system permease subunit YejB